jgi:hypothetical protein
VTPHDWLTLARTDARERGLETTVTVLEAFARAMQVLRDAPWNERAAPAPQGRSETTHDDAR